MNKRHVVARAVVMTLMVGAMLGAGDRLQAQDDSARAAKEQARKLVDGHDVELWQLDRKISVFLSGPE